MKAVILAFWVTPLGSIPDELGHYNYVRDIATGEGIPVLGTTRPMQDFFSAFSSNRSQDAYTNHIAQHPPVFYLIAAAPLWMMSSFTSDSDLLLRAPRLVASAAGAATLVVLYQLMFLLTRRSLLSIGVMACVSFIPMFSNMSSGTNNDTTVTFFASLAVLYWCKLLLHDNVRHAYWTAFWLSLACATKMTVLVIAAPMVAIMLLELTGPWRSRVLHGIGITSLALLLPGAWMLRNFILFRNPFMTATDLPGWYRQAHDPLDDTFLEYLNNQPVIDGFFTSFLGFFLDKVGLLRNLTPDKAFSEIYSVIALAILLFGLFWLVMNTFRHDQVEQPTPERATGVNLVSSLHGCSFWIQVDRIIRGLMPVALAVAAILSFEFIYAPADAWERRLVYSCLAVAFVLSLAVYFVRMGRVERLPLYALSIIAFFSVVFLWKVYGIYLLDGRLRGIQGRYFFPLIPLMLVGIVFPALKLLRLRAWPVIMTAILLAFTELYFFNYKVMPFYMGR